MSDIHRLDEPIYESAWRDRPLLRSLTLQEQYNEQQFAQEQIRLVNFENRIEILHKEEDDLYQDIKIFYNRQGSLNYNYRVFFLNYIKGYYEYRPALEAKFLHYYTNSILWLHNRLKYLSHYNDPQYIEPWAFAHVNIQLINQALQVTPTLEKTIEEVNQAKIPLDKELALIKQKLEAGCNPDNIDLTIFKKTYKAFQLKFELARALLLDYEDLSVQINASRLGDKGSLEENIQVYAFALVRDIFYDNLGWLELLSKPIHL